MNKRKNKMKNTGKRKKGIVSILMTQEHKEPNVRGMEFEDLVSILLMLIKERHPSTVKISRHPRIELQNGTVAIPDFEFIYELPHQRDGRIIECQDRERSSQEIVHKIRTMKSLSSKNRFILVFKDSHYLSSSVQKALDADGVVYYSLLDFGIFLNQISETLGAVAGATPDLGAAAKSLQESSLATEMTGLFKKHLGSSTADKFSRSLSDPPEKKSDGAMLSTWK